MVFTFFNTQTKYFGLILLPSSDDFWPHHFLVKHNFLKPKKKGQTYVFEKKFFWSFNQKKMLYHKWWGKKSSLVGIYIRPKYLVWILKYVKTKKGYDYLAFTFFIQLWKEDIWVIKFKNWLVFCKYYKSAASTNGSKL